MKGKLALIRWKEHPEYTDFMLKYIPGHTGQEIRQEFKRLFGIILSEGQIGNFKHKYGIKSGTHGGQFKLGQIAHNKGKKMSPELKAKVSRTFFQKGHMPANHRRVGSERLNVDGYIEIKVQEPNKWRLKQRVVYEQYYGVKLAKNEVIIFLDGNKLNFDIDNLYKMDRAGLARYNQDHLYGKDREINRAAAHIARLKTEIKRNEKPTRNGDS